MADPQQGDWFQANAPSTATSTGTKPVTAPASTTHATPPANDNWFSLNAPGKPLPDQKESNPDFGAVAKGAGKAFLKGLPFLGATAATIGSGGILTPMLMAGLGGAAGKAAQEAIEPDVDSTPDMLKAVGEEGLMNAIGEGGGRLVGKGIGHILEKKFSPNSLFSSAYKPHSRVPGRPLTLDQVDKLGSTAAEHGITASEKGADKLAGIREGLHKQSLDIVNQRSPQLFPIKRDDILKRLDDVRAQFADPMSKAMTQDDATAIDAVGDEFRSKPAFFSASETQTMKTGTYRDLQGKYGKLSSAQIESEKALARGMKEELIKRIPELKELGEKESELIKLEDQLQRFLGRERNKNVTGLIPATLVGSTFGALAGHSGGGAGMSAGAALGAGVADSLVLAMDNPEIKSTLSNLLRKAATTKAGIVARRAAPYVTPAVAKGVGSMVTSNDSENTQPDPNQDE